MSSSIRGGPDETTHAAFAGTSITGRGRDVNEDAWGAVAEAGVVVVADGCGGVGSGRAAAELAIETFQQVLTAGRALPEAEPLAVATWEANRRIGEAAVGPRRGMGSALAALRLAAHEAGDMYLVCTDGVWRALAHAEIAAVAGQADQSLEERCRQLVEQADERRGHDNATAVLLCDRPRARG